MPEVKIGVLSHRGYEATLRNWSPTADYLSRVIPEYRFVIVPLDFREIEPAVKYHKVDFLLVNPGIYVNMEVKYRISRIATLNNLVNDQPSNVFGGVLFTRANNVLIHRLGDLRNRYLMAVDQTSLGGFQMVWKEMKKIGFDPYRDTAALSFAGTHDAVVKAVLNGKVDAGIVRTGILESLLEDGQELEQVFKIINEQKSPQHPFSHSTELYPEWPFSKLQHTPNDLGQRVAVALLKMSPLEPAAQWGEYAGWTIPLEYQPVHDLLKELHLSPYDQPARFTLSDALKKYWLGLLLVSIVFLIILGLVIRVIHLNRELEKSKKILEKQHHLVLDAVTDGIYGVDLDGNTTFINKAMQNITGWTEADLIGKNQHQLLHHTRIDGRAFPQEECPIYLTCKYGRSLYIEKDIFWRKDGKALTVEYSSNPLRNEKGFVTGAVVVFRDISQKVKEEEALQEYKNKLAHVSRLNTMGEMASGMAHELNQPLTAIATSADASIRLLENQPDARDKLIDVLENISLQARRAGQIIQQLRQFVRKEAPVYSPAQINPLIEEVLLLVQAEIKKQDIEVKKYLEPDLPEVCIQRIQIDQVILNLIRNAIEAMQNNRVGKILTLHSYYRPETQEVVVCIEDTGEGIDESMMDKLFTPFHTTKPQGMGLGLSISQGIIEAHGGRLYPETKLGRGARFCFSLPVDQSACTR